MNLNKWFIVDLKKVTSGTNNDEMEEVQGVLLDDMATHKSENVCAGAFGAFLTLDVDADGCHVVAWIGTPCTLQEDTVLHEHDLPHVVKAGELVCDGKCHNPVPLAHRWCTAAESETSKTVVHVQQVVFVDLESMPMSKKINHQSAVMFGLHQNKRHCVCLRMIMMKF